ncbi:serine protease inhibitor Kazal-type 2 isoform X1 [Pan troglodytes]|uniref:serine protease inhibitor Kazal-type 2 isoform X1 n=1 Tax=Pan troglodytes TaxID=9598 RepID=UPI0023F31480|nr:serine protease inhibitor Kazal-type 2 isoform X1 [Pan troglodytes]
MALAVLRLALLLLAVTFAGSARSGPGERGPPDKSGIGSQAGGGPCPAPGGLGDGTRAPVTGGSPEDLPGGGTRTGGCGGGFVESATLFSSCLGFAPSSSLIPQVGLFSKYRTPNCSQYRLPGCPRHFNPVCGSDMSTYANECTLCMKIREGGHNIKIIRNGPC